MLDPRIFRKPRQSCSEKELPAEGTRAVSTFRRFPYFDFSPFPLFRRFLTYFFFLMNGIPFVIHVGAGASRRW